MSAISGLASEEEGVAVLQPNIRKGQGSLAQADGPKPVRINPGDNGRDLLKSLMCVPWEQEKTMIWCLTLI